MSSDHVLNWPISFSRHARRRMQERDISEEQVRGAIYHPDQSWLGDEGEVNVRKRLSHCTIRICYISLARGPKVITVIVE